MLKLVYSISLLFFICSCNKPDFSKVKNPTWDPNLAAPIGYSDFDVYDILASQNKTDLIVISDLGELALNYKGEVASFSADQIAQLDNQSLDIILDPTDQGISAISSFSSSISQTVPELLNFSLNNGVQLEQLYLYSGILNLQISTELKHDVIFTLSFPDIIKNGTPLSYSVAANYSGTAPHGATGVVDLSGSIIDLTAGGSAANNSLRVNLATTINGTGNPISGNENSNINLSFNGMSVDKAFGYFGQQSIVSQSDSILLKIFNSSTTGVFQLTNPKLRFKVINSFGIPVQLDISNLKSINPITGLSIPLTSLSTNNVLISAASSISDSSVSDIPELNQFNTTNMNSLVNNTPKYLAYTVSAITNPSGFTSNFITRESKIKVNAELELPLEGYAYDFVITDTFPFNFSDNADQVESVMLRLISENGFPISFQSQLEFLDETNSLLFSLLNDAPEIIAAAPVNGDGKVSNKVKKIKDVVIPKNYISLLSSVKNIVVKGMAATTQPQSTIVKIYDDYNLYIKLSMQVKLKLDL
jgi:hypothetical protein